MDLSLSHKIPKFSINGSSLARTLTPDAGTPRPELAGRNNLIERVAIALNRTRARRAASFILPGVDESSLVAVLLVAAGSLRPFMFSRWTNRT